MSSDKTNNPKEKLFPDQLDDEEVLLMFRKHPIVMRKGLIYGMLGPLIGELIGIFISWKWPEVGVMSVFGGLIGGILLGLLILFPSWINWYFSLYIVTNIRFIQVTQKGLFNKSFVDLSLNQIQSLNYEIKGLEATIFGYGTILVQTYMGDLVIHHLHRPAKLYKQLLIILREEGIEPVKYTPDSAQEETAKIEETES